MTPDGNVNRALSPPHTSDFSSSGGSPPPPSVPQIQPPQLYGIAQQGGGGGYSTVPHIPAPSSHHSDDDIIPNAIVIKNIPFTVKRETLLDIIVRALTSLSPFVYITHTPSLVPFRPPSTSPLLTRSTTISTLMANSGGSRSQTSGSQGTRTRSSPPSTGSTSKVANFASSTRKSSSLGRRSGSNAKRPCGG